MTSRGEGVIVFDTETTGLLLHPSAALALQPEIIELGAVLLNREGKTVEVFGQLIKPRSPVSAEITKITGITNDMLARAPSFAEALPVIRRFFAQGFAIFAHNLPFDRTMMRNELARIDCLDFPWPHKEYCTVGMHRHLWGRNPKLVELYEFAMERPLPQTHRAEEDAAALAEVVVAQKLHSLAYEEAEA